jgi:hypothetical protein
VGIDKSRGDHSLLYFAYTCVRDLFIGGLFTLQKRLQGDGILHVKSLKIYYVMVFYMLTCFTVLKSPILHVNVLQNLLTMSRLDPIFYRTLFYDFHPVISPSDK